MTIEVSLLWRFSAPSSELEHSMEEFEALLQPLVDAAASMLVVVVTVAKTREWIFYVSDYSRFENGLNHALRTQTRYPIEVSWSEDPDWQVYERLVSPVLERASR